MARPSLSCCWMFVISPVQDSRIKLYDNMYDTVIYHTQFFKCLFVNYCRLNNTEKRNVEFIVQCEHNTLIPFCCSRLQKCFFQSLPSTRNDPSGPPLSFLLDHSWNLQFTGSQLAAACPLASTGAESAATQTSHCSHCLARGGRHNMAKPSHVIYSYSIYMICIYIF